MSQGASGTDGTSHRNTNKVVMESNPKFKEPEELYENEERKNKIIEQLQISNKKNEKEIEELKRMIQQLQDSNNKSDTSNRNTNEILKKQVSDQNKKIEQLKRIIEQLEDSNNKSGGSKSSWSSWFSNQSPKPTGLKNVGLNCYMNAALQALSGSSKFVEEIKSFADENGELKKLNLFTNLLNSLNETSQSSINAAYNDLFENWSKSGMQDAFEVMSFMLNEVIKEYKGKYKYSQTEWNKINYPMVLKLTYKLECGRNHGIKTPVQTDLALHVPIPAKGRNITITDVLNEVVEGESISEYSCDTEGCRSKRGKKYMKLVEVPNILCIHIQRNKASSSGMMLKNYAKITLESDKLELSRHLFLNNNWKCTYQLCSVIDHSGSLTGGHYVCYKRFDNKWYCANDSSVREIKFTRFNDCGMYVLIYELVKKEEITSVDVSEKQITFQEDCTVLLSMLHSSNVFMKKLEELRDFHLTQVEEVYEAIVNIQKQVKFYDNGSTLDDLLFVILEPIKKEILESIKEEENPSSSYIPMYLKWVESVQCNDKHQLSSQNITDFTFTVLVTGIKNKTISFSELMNDLVKGIDIKGECKCSGCYSRSLKRFVKFEKLPPILCIRIEREDHENSSSGKYQKINVDKYLKLDKKFLMNGDEEGHYKLCSVIVHQNSNHNDSRYKCYKLRNNECYNDNDGIVDFNIISNSKIELLLFEKTDENSRDITSSNDDSKFENISQVSINSVLSMLLSSEILLKKLEDLEGFQLSKVKELVGALQGYRDNKKQTQYYDIKSTLNEVFHDILEPINNEMEKASNCTSSNDIDIPLCLKLFIQTKCSRGHIRSEQELFEFTFTVTVKDNCGTKIALSKLMKDSVDGINISSNTCSKPPCPSNTVKKFVKFVKLPNILCIRIERRDSERREFQKIDVNKTLKLDKKYLKNENEEGVYKLRSVIVHSDSDSGQYKCYTYRDGKWVDDDNKILDYDEINDRKIELLLYELVMEDSQSNNTHYLNAARSYKDALQDKSNVYTLNDDKPQGNSNVDILNDDTSQDDSNAVLSMLLSSEILMKKLEDLEGFQLPKVNELVGALQDYRDNKNQTRYADIKSTLNEMFTYILDPVKEETTTYSLRSDHRATFPMTLDMCEITRCDSDSSHIKSEEYFTELFLSLSISYGGTNKISDFMDGKFRVKILNDEKCQITKWGISCKSPMKKYLKFEKLPTILYIQIEQNRGNKHAQITVDREIKLDKKYLKNENEEGVYKLRSVVHSDSDSGPYKCYTYRDDKWVDGNKEIESRTIKTNIEFLLYELFDEKSLLSKSRGSISQPPPKCDTHANVNSESITQTNSNFKSPQSNVNSGSITPSNSISKPSPTGVNSASITPSNSNSKPSPTGVNSGSITPSNSNSKHPQNIVNSILTLISSSDVFMKSLNDFFNKTQGTRVNEVEKLWTVLESVRDNKVQGVYFDSRGNCLDLLKGILEGPMKEMDGAINKIQNLEKFKNPLTIVYDEELRCYIYEHLCPTRVSSFYCSLIVPENTRGSHGKMNFNDLINNWFGGFISFDVDISCPFLISNYSKCSSMFSKMTYKMKYVPKVFIINLERKSRSSMKLTIEKELIIKINSVSEFKYKLCGFLHKNGYGDLDVFKLQNKEWFRFKGTEFVKKYNDHELTDIQPDLLIYEHIYFQSSV